jgi:thiol-disulfide isomerase/thioredoxin
MRWVATAVVSICLLGLPGVRAAIPEEVPIGGVLRDATMRGLNGPARHLSEFRGRPLLINVWASWCGPCRAEMASLERLAWLDETKYFTIIGVSTDDYVDKAQAALTAWNSTITHFIDKDLELEKMLGASTLPLTVLVDADGRVLGKVHGAQEWDGREALDYIHATFKHPPSAASATAKAVRSATAPR